MHNDNADTYFSYDAHGRVKRVIQHAVATDKYSTVDYVYSALTSQVQQIIYQQDVPTELFIHRYKYDKDSRLDSVQVSHDGITWQQAGKYTYYMHGPLKSKVLGDSIQLVDYVYNINGWLKAINNPMAANTGSTADVFSEVLNYYAGDFSKSGASTGFGYAQPPSSIGLMDAESPDRSAVERSRSRDLYSGNISSTLSYHAFSKTTAGAVKEYKAEVYRYDLLNRLKSSGVALGSAQADGSPDWTSFQATGEYGSNYKYDANGNMMRLNRKAYAGSSTGTNTMNMDDLVYRYATDGNGHKLNNKLLAVRDSADATNDLGDWKASSRTGDDFVYDARGRMISNAHDGIQEIQYTAYNKVKKVIPLAGSGKPTIEYVYDAMGNRISKKETFPDNHTQTTSYVYDASGILMAIYENTALSEMPIYGSDRLGTYRPGTGAFFELTNHLGTVTAVVKDTKKADGSVDIVSLQDYYPGGMDMPGRTFTNGAYSFGYQGSLKANELGANQYTTYFRELDTRIMRWTSPDPVNHPWESPYAVNSNNPIVLIDPMGDAGKQTVTSSSSGTNSNGSTWESESGVGANGNPYSLTVTTPGSKASGGTISKIGNTLQSIGDGIVDVTKTAVAGYVKYATIADRWTQGHSSYSVNSGIVLGSELHDGGNNNTYVNNNGKNHDLGPIVNADLIEVAATAYGFENPNSSFSTAEVFPKLAESFKSGCEAYQESKNIKLPKFRVVNSSTVESKPVKTSQSLHNTQKIVKASTINLKKGERVVPQAYLGYSSFSDVPGHPGIQCYYYPDQTRRYYKIIEGDTQLIAIPEEERKELKLP